MKWPIVATAEFAISSLSQAQSTPKTPAPSMRAQATVENWDKGGALTHWVYAHISEVFPAAIVRRAGPIVELTAEPRPEIGALNVSDPNEPKQTLDEFIKNGAVDGCIVLHRGRIVYEKYPTIQPNDISSEDRRRMERTKPS